MNSRPLVVILVYCAVWLVCMDGEAVPGQDAQASITVAGQVVGDNGHPVVGAAVTAVWTEPDESGDSSVRQTTLVSDESGHFAIHGVPVGAQGAVVAVTGDMAVESFVRFSAESEQPLELQASAANMVSLRGQVRDANGKAVKNAEIRLVHQLVLPGHSGKLVETDRVVELRTGRDGQFQSDDVLPRYGRYRIRISAPDSVPFQLNRMQVLPAASSLPPIEVSLIPTRTVIGVVKDSGGQPVSGATVWSWGVSSDHDRDRCEKQTAFTGKDGRFRLTSIHPDAVVIFAHSSGYRQSGSVLWPDRSGVRFSLQAIDEAVAPNAVRPTVFDNDRRFTAAGRLFDGVAAKRRGSELDFRNLLEMLARIDRDPVRAELSAVDSARTRAEVLAELGETVAAAAELDGMEDGYDRVKSRIAVSDRIDDNAQAVELLKTAVGETASIRRKEQRVAAIAEISRRLTDRGEALAAEQLLQRTLPDAEFLSTRGWPGFARGLFAAELAVFDPDTAMSLVAELEPKERERHYRNLAHRVADSDPQAAEMALGHVVSPRWIDAAAVRVACRMAVTDAERAIRLLDRVDRKQRPTERPRGLGVVAWRLRDSDPQRARELLELAFDSLPEPQSGTRQQSQIVFGAAVMLLQLAETIDPDRLTEYFWRTVMCQEPPRGVTRVRAQRTSVDVRLQSRLALMFLLYDAAPRLPQQMMEPVFRTWKNELGTDSVWFTQQQDSFLAMTLTDPQRTADWAIRFEQQLHPDVQDERGQPWKTVGFALSRDREEIGGYIIDRVFHRWMVGRYDL